QHLRSPLFPYTTLFRSEGTRNLLLAFEADHEQIARSVRPDLELEFGFVRREGCSTSGHGALPSSPIRLLVNFVPSPPQCERRWRSEEHTSELQSPYDLV